MSRGLVVKIAVGAEDPERMQTGLTVAAAACAAGVDVTLWLAGGATRLGVASRGDTEPLGEEPMELFAVVLAQGSVAVCARCAQRRGIGPDDLLPGVEIQGAATFVAAIMRPDVQALVY